MANAQGTRGERREQARAAREEAERRDAAAAARKRRIFQLGGLVLVAAVVVVVAIVVSSGGTKKTPAKKAGERVPGQSLAAAEFGGIAQSGNALGSAKAPHTLVEYGDLVCPACKAYSDQILPAIIQKYVRSGQLRIEFKPFQFVRPYSQQAAQYGIAAGLQDKAWDFDRVWYVNQGDESTNYVNDAFARKIASGVPGLDADKLIADSKTAKVKAEVAANESQFNNLGFDSTPSFAGGTTGGTMKPVDLSSDPDAAIQKLVGG